MQYVKVEPIRLAMTNVLIQSFNFQIQTQHYNTRGVGRFNFNTTQNLIHKIAEKFNSDMRMQ